MIDSGYPPIRTASLARLAATRRLERATSMPFAAGRRPAARSAGPRSTGHPKSIIARLGGRGKARERLAHADRLLAALDLERAGGGDLDAAGDLVDGGQRRAHPDLRADRQRG